VSFENPITTEVLITDIRAGANADPSMAHGEDF
jgi:hypothetical protein